MYACERLLLPANCLMRVCGIRREPKHNFRNGVLPPAHPAPPPLANTDAGYLLRL